MRLRTRLVASLLLVALLPAVPLSLAVRSLLARSFGPAVDGRLESALAAGLAESRERLAERRAALALAASSLAPQAATAPDGDGGLPLLLVEMTGEARTCGTAPPAAQRQGLQAWGAAAAASCPAAATAPGVPLSGPERVDGWLALLAAGGDGRPVIVATPLPDSLAARAAALGDGLSLLRLLKQERGAVLRSYVLPFVAIYALLVATALLAGAWLAGRIARPLEALAACSRRVAAGDLDARCETDGGGETGELVTAFNDMLARLAAQRRELARLERLAAWRNMARTLAHEIKNPLQPILLAVQSARQGYRGDDPGHARLLADCEEIVSEEVESLRALVRGFSDFARMPEPKLANGDLCDLPAEMARLYGPDRVVAETSGEPVPARFDPAELRRALVNLVDNALAACAGAGIAAPVRVTCGRDAGGAWLAVADEGPGIAPEDLARIFEPDYSTKKDGMGLGLAIVDGIARGHGGSVRAASAVGRGATFTLRLP